MSRFRLLSTPAQQAVLRDHCGHARYIWNLAVEQHSHWHPGNSWKWRGSTYVPGRRATPSC
jgi:Helix-turn-helix domain